MSGFAGLVRIDDDCNARGSQEEPGANVSETEIPEAPYGFEVAQATTRFIKLQWKRVNSNKLYGYRLERSFAFQNMWTSTHTPKHVLPRKTTSFKVGEVEPYEEYDFCLKSAALNSKGELIFSDGSILRKVEAKEKGQPFPPRNVMVKDIKEDSVTLTWLEPLPDDDDDDDNEDDCSASFEYVIDMCDYGDGKIVSVWKECCRTEKLECTVKVQHKGTCCFRVSAHNTKTTLCSSPQEIRDPQVRITIKEKNGETIKQITSRWIVKQTTLDGLEPGSIVFVVSCQDMSGLRELWMNYNLGKLKKFFQDLFALAASLASEVSDTDLDLDIVIDPEDVYACRQHLILTCATQIGVRVVNMEDAHLRIHNKLGLSEDYPVYCKPLSQRTSCSQLDYLDPAMPTNKVTERSPGTTERSPGTTERPPGTTERPPGTTKRPPGTTKRSPGTPKRSPGTPKRSPGTTERSPGTTERSPGTTERPPGTAERSPGTTERPPGTPKRSPGTTERSPGTTERSPGTTERPPGTPKRSPGTTERSPGTTEGSSGTTERSPGTTEGSPGTTERSPVTTERPPGTTERSPGTTERSPETTESPPGTTERSPGTPKRSPGTTERSPETTESPPGTTKISPVSTEKSNLERTTSADSLTTLLVPPKKQDIIHHPLTSLDLASNNTQGYTSFTDWVTYSSIRQLAHERKVMLKKLTTLKTEQEILKYQLESERHSIQLLHKQVRWQTKEMEKADKILIEKDKEIEDLTRANKSMAETIDEQLAAKTKLTNKLAMMEQEAKFNVDREEVPGLSQNELQKQGKEFDDASKGMKETIEELLAAKAKLTNKLAGLEARHKIAQSQVELQEEMVRSLHKEVTRLRQEKETEQQILLDKGKKTEDLTYVQKKEDIKVRITNKLATIGGEEQEQMPHKQALDEAPGETVPSTQVKLGKQMTAISHDSQSTTSALQKEKGQQLDRSKDRSYLYELSTKQRQLQEALFEVLKTEGSYLHSMTVFVQHFMSDEELRNSIKSSEYNTLISNSGEVLKASQLFINDLKARQEENVVVTDVCDIIANHAKESFLVPYKKYCENLPLQKSTLKSLTEGTQSQELNRNFCKALKKLEMDEICGKLPFSSFLLLPMQHITRFPLMVERIMNMRETDTELFNTAWDALMAVRDVSKQCNQATRKVQQMIELEDLVKKLAFDKVNLYFSLLNKERSIIKQGELTCIQGRGKNVKHHLVLLTDYLLVTKKKEDKKEGGQLSLRNFCKRDRVFVREIDSIYGSYETSLAKKEQKGFWFWSKPVEENFRFSVTLLEDCKGKEEEMVFAAKTQSDLTRWVEAFQQLGTDEEEGRISQKDNCSIVRVILRRDPEEPDELALEEGDTLFVLRNTPDGWWFGETMHDERQGWFPATVVEEVMESDHFWGKELRREFIMSQLKREQELELDKHTFTVLHDYESEIPEYLKIRKDQHLKIMDYRDGQWYKAQSLDTLEVGLVPSNYVAPLHGVQGHKWFEGPLDRRDTETRLLCDDNPVGTFLVRSREDIGETGSHPYTISVLRSKTGNDRVRHFKVQRSTEGKVFVAADMEFDSLRELVEHYLRVGRIGSCPLSAPCPATMTDVPQSHAEIWEISRDNIKLQRKIGQGNLCNVFQGLWKESVVVAMKTVRKGMMPDDQILLEADTMKNLLHRNIVQLLGVCTKGYPIYIITEFMCNGSLDHYLRHEEGHRLDLVDLIDMGAQVAAGMEYLEDNNVIHRDLRASNVLVGERNLCKVANFRMARLDIENLYLGTTDGE
ncbi:uncharacterized protein LOC144863085 [Branchiostoma floridae x Branchiostoma japonicum]